MATAPLTTLPLEIFQMIMRELVMSVGLIRAGYFRSVNKIFDFEIQRAIFARHTFDFNTRENIQILKRMGHAFNSRLLLERTLHGDVVVEHGSTRSLLLETIRRTAHLTQSNIEMQEKTRILCHMAVVQLDSRTMTVSKVSQEIRNDTDRVGLCNEAELLAAAAGCGNLELLKSNILQGKWSPALRSHFFGTPLTAAAGQGHIEVVRFLAKNGFLGAYDKCDTTPLAAAAVEGQARVVRLLLEEYNVPVTESAVKYAVKSGDISILQMLIHFGAPVLGRHALLKETLENACRYGPVRMVQLVFNDPLGQEVLLACGRRPLFDAVMLGHLRVVQLLLKNDAHKNHPFDLARCLFYAIQQGFNGIVQELSGKGNFKSPINLNGILSIRFHLENFVDENNLKHMRRLVESGFEFPLDVDTKDRLMDRASKKENWEMASLLIDLKTY